MFEVYNVKNKAILRDILNFWTRQRQKRSNSATVPHFSKLTTSKTKQFFETSFKNGKLESWVQSLTALMKMSLVLRLPRKMHLCRSPSNVPRLTSFVEIRQKPHVLLTLEKVHNPLRLPRETTSEPPKVRTCGALYILTSKCALRHNGVHFFDISTSKSGPDLVCFVHFDFEMCFAPQRRSLFRHINFQKCPGPGVFCTFRLRHVLRATMACNFSLPSGLRTRCFSEPTFRPSRATNHWKNTVFRDFPTFSRICIFFLVTLSLLWSSLLLFSSLWLFPSLLFICPYRRKFDF